MSTVSLRRKGGGGEFVDTMPTYDISCISIFETVRSHEQRNRCIYVWLYLEIKDDKKRR